MEWPEMSKSQKRTYLWQSLVIFGVLLILLIAYIAYLDYRNDSLISSERYELTTYFLYYGAIVYCASAVVMLTLKGMMIRESKSRHTERTGSFDRK